jgi:hypothetical protein
MALFNLEQEIVDHAACQFHSPGAQQSENYEITVPSIHFVEAAAGNHIFIFQIEQSVRLNLAGIDLAQVIDLDG